MKRKLLIEQCLSDALKRAKGDESHTVYIELKSNYSNYIEPNVKHKAADRFSDVVHMSCKRHNTV